jgi:Fe-S cluster biosynthesis and repair protein YggX
VTTPALPLFGRKQLFNQIAKMVGQTFAKHGLMLINGGS